MKSADFIRREEERHRRSSAWWRGFGLGMALMQLLMLAIWVVPGWLASAKEWSDEVRRRERAEREFVRACIEHHPRARCRDLWELDRQDLGTRP